MLFEKQVLAMYKGMMHVRCDDNGTAFYFSSEDFEGLHREPYVFTSSAGHKLRGYIYHYASPKAGRLVIFDHGFGGGHRSYMKEIERLCRHGFLVLAYDHTGCMESGGESPNGMAQSLSDLNDCINAVKSDARFEGMDISVIGHSWGGFSTMNISALHPEISHVVVLSGFVSVEELVKSYFGGIMKGYRRTIMALERSVNPRFVEFHGVQSLKNYSGKALLIYSENDKMCAKVHYDILKAGLAGKENISFLLVKNKGHNPNYTEDAVAYLGEYVAAKTKLARKKHLESEEEKRAFVSSFDWNRMTAQDEDVWANILACLDS
ncbi:MAG: alpha/beta hydrolase [Clostridia bacterium]|nr:alpha/beta hydrolase [Clostridia bacterium]